MVTGDHPLTALAIARELGLADSMEQVVTGPRLREAEDIAPLVAGARVFARVEPEQKLFIVNALSKAGHFVAVTGDGANDAPALRAAHVGVAMGKSGTDVARETADLILTDDAFASIVGGIEEGRVAYSNVRKVIFLLISTGAGTVLAFIGALVLGLPMLFTAVQLLWLNLVTNGIQDVALAFEPGEGDELKRPPRAPGEAIFNGVMLGRVLLSALVIGGLCLGTFKVLLDMGWDEAAARNAALLLMVLFQNAQVGNSRSETRSVLVVSPLRNPLLLAGTAAAQLLHIGAMYTPGVREILHLQPVSLELWGAMLGLALSLVVVMEIYKLVAYALTAKTRTGPAAAT